MDVSGQVMPIVSIVIPVYNASQYLERCIRSLCDQTLGDIEIICIDDCSWDDSRQILRRVSQEDSRICVELMSENVGAGECRNAGIRMARGDYLCFVDADDYADHRMCEVLVEKARETDSDLVLGVTRCVGENGGVLQEPTMMLVPFIQSCTNLDNIKMKPELVFTRFSPWAKLVRKSLMSDHGIEFQRSHVGNDARCSVELFLAASKISAIKEIVYFYCADTQGSTIKQKTRRRFDIFKVWDEIGDVLNKYGVYNIYRDAYFRFQQASLIYGHYSHFEGRLREEYYLQMKERFRNIPRQSLSFGGWLVLSCNYTTFRRWWLLAGVGRRFIYIWRKIKWG